jgi:hypothetical protein
MQDNWLLFLISRYSTLLRVVVRGQLQSKYSIPILAIHYIQYSPVVTLKTEAEIVEQNLLCLLEWLLFNAT